MKTLFDAESYQEIIRRLDAIRPDSPRQWGSMTPAQMLEHVARAVDMAAGKGSGKQMLMGRLIGWAFKADFIGPKPFPKNGPTGPDFIIKEEPDFAATKSRLRASLAGLVTLGERGCEGHVHGFFGRLTGKEWGITQYKHLDHHLRQFNA